MPIETSEREHRSRSDWEHAFDAIHKLAVSRGIIEADSAKAQSLDALAAASPDLASATGNRDDQLARDLAEIAAATRELRRAEPSLTPISTLDVEPPPPRSAARVWLLIWTIWLTATALTGSALFAIIRLA